MSLENLYPQLAFVGQTVGINPNRNATLPYFSRLPHEAEILEVTKLHSLVTYWIMNIHGRKVPIDNTFIQIKQLGRV
jgi:hypothetical protein